MRTLFRRRPGKGRLHRTRSQVGSSDVTTIWCCWQLLQINQEWFVAPVWAGLALLKKPGISARLTNDSAGLALVLVAERGSLVDHMRAPLGSLRPLCVGMVVWCNQRLDQVLLTTRHNHPLLQGKEIDVKQCQPVDRQKRVNREQRQS